MLSKYGMETLKFGDGEVIPSHTLLGILLLIHAGIQMNICQ